MLIAILQIVTAIGLIGFWTLFFTVGLAPAAAPACYFAYEHAFPVPDMMLAGLLLASGLLLARGHALGRRLSLVAAGALIFLGVLDACFNTQNGVYLISTGDLVGNAAINIWCMVFGLFMVVRFARQHEG